MLATYLQDQNAKQKKKYQLTKERQSSSYKREKELEMCEWCKEVTYKENERAQQAKSISKRRSSPAIKKEKSTVEEMREVILLLT